jgi:hypothetical protein
MTARTTVTATRTRDRHVDGDRENAVTATRTRDRHVDDDRDGDGDGDVAGHSEGDG